MSGKPLLYFIFTVVSGGLEPQGVNPRAVAVMAEVGVDISGQQSKPLI